MFVTYTRAAHNWTANVLIGIITIEIDNSVPHDRTALTDLAVFQGYSVTLNRERVTPLLSLSSSMGITSDNSNNVIA